MEPNPPSAQPHASILDMLCLAWGIERPADSVLDEILFQKQTDVAPNSVEYSLLEFARSEIAQ